MITCLAVCAAILPKFFGTNSTSTVPSICASLSIFLASSNDICKIGFSACSTTSFTEYKCDAPVSLSTTTLTFSCEL